MTAQNQSYREIPLTNGGTTIVSEADYEKLRCYRWSRSQTGHIYRSEGRKVTYHMHRVILGLGKGDSRQADHINGNKADNRRENLRIASPSQNRANTGKDKRNKSGHKGISFRNDGRHHSWIVFCRINGQAKQKTGFKTIEEAIEYRDSLYRQMHGEFANFD